MAKMMTVLQATIVKGIGVVEPAKPDEDPVVIEFKEDNEAELLRSCGRVRDFDPEKDTPKAKKGGKAAGDAS